MSTHEFARARRPVAAPSPVRTATNPMRTAAPVPRSGHSGHDFSRIPVHSSFGDAPSGSPVAVPYRAQMESAFGDDFSGVKVYLGRSGALDRLHANAATAGEQIAFGSSSPDQRLVAHELAHVVQQRRGGAMQLQSQISRPGAAAEQEADRVAHRAAAGERVAVSAAPGAAIHRDMKDKKLDVPLGHFEIDMTKVEAKGAKTGEEGNISFTPNDKAPDSKSIRLSQAAKVFDVGASADVDWTKESAGGTVGKLANLNKVRTSAANKTHVTVKGETLKKIAEAHYGESTPFAEIFDANKSALASEMKTADGNKSLLEKLSLTIPKAVLGGYFIDHLSYDPKAKVRAAKTDPEVPQDYVWPGEEVKGKNQHGSKAGKAIVPAILDDKPKTTGHRQYTFQTLARSDDTGIYYGTVHWTFDADGGAGKVTKESYRVAPGVSDTFRGALDLFNKFYKNPPYGP